MKLLRQNQKSVEKELHNYRKYDINVGKETHDELIELVAHIYRTSKKELEDVFTEADKAGKGDALRKKWRQDVDDRMSFKRDQEKNS